MKSSRFLLISILLTLGIFPVSAQVDLAFSGFVDTFHGFRMDESTDYLSSRTRLRFQMDADTASSHLFTSLNAEYNPLFTDRTAISLHEAYFEYFGSYFDLRAGKQIITWGRADGVDITNVLNPRDYTEFLGVEYDDTKIPIEALKLRGLLDFMTVEAVWLPIYTPARFPTDPENPWFAAPAAPPANVTLAPEEGEWPKSFTDAGEWGLRLSFFLPLIDLSVSVFYGWDDVPYTKKDVSTDGSSVFFNLRPEYYKRWGTGLDFALPVSDFVFRFEAAYANGKFFEPDYDLDALFAGVTPANAASYRDSIISATKSLKKDTIAFLVGVDWNPGSNWTVVGQFTDNVLLGYDEKIARKEHELAVTFNVSKKLLRETLTLSALGYFDISNLGGYGRFSAEYAIDDSLHIAAGTNVFFGDKDSGGSFGQYSDNSAVWVMGKYSF